MPTTGMDKPTPLDELAEQGEGAIDALWEKIDGREMPTREEWLVMIEHQRRLRDEWQRKQEEKEK